MHIKSTLTTSTNNITTVSLIWIVFECLLDFAICYRRNRMTWKLTTLKMGKLTGQSCNSRCLKLKTFLKKYHLTLITQVWHSVTTCMPMSRNSWSASFSLRFHQSLRHCSAASRRSTVGVHQGICSWILLKLSWSGFDQGSLTTRRNALTSPCMFVRRRLSKSVLCATLAFFLMKNLRWSSTSARWPASHFTTSDD